MSDAKTLLIKGVEEVIVKEHLEKELQSGKKLRVKFGIDPTAPDLHLGHTVALRKLREFQDAGHKAVLIIGDFTAMIGDPSGRVEARKPLTKKEVQANMKKYLAQAAKVLDIKKAEIRYNSDWLRKNVDTIMEVSRAGTVNQVLHRADFKKRIDEGREVSMLEALYPLFQGYDSVAVKADIELGGTDQKFNLLMGRHLQKHFGMKEQDVVTLPLLEGTDGVRKMSKSFGNYIALNNEPNDMFGKVMSVPDNLVEKYFILLTLVPFPKELDPREAKLLLARTIVGMYHGEKTGEKAKEEWIRVFSKKEAPSEMTEIEVPKGETNFLEILHIVDPNTSNSAWRRLADDQKAIELDGKSHGTAEVVEIEGGEVLRIGKKKFFKLK